LNAFPVRTNLSIQKPVKRKNEAALIEYNDVNLEPFPISDVTSVFNILGMTQIEISMTQVLGSPVSPRLLHALANNWWLLLLRGIAGVSFGILTFVWPGMTLLTLVLLYGVFAVVDGALAVAAAMVGGASRPRSWLLLVGLLGITLGTLTLAWPDVIALVLLLFIAGWAIGTGVLQIVGAIRLRKEINNEWLLIATGVLSIVFGLVLAAQPGVGALALLFTIGTFAIVYGSLLIVLAFKLRRHARIRD
jgi:uncharacterized membrane protein HdeD (DUF308 family)